MDSNSVGRELVRVFHLDTNTVKQRLLVGNWIWIYLNSGLSDWVRFISVWMFVLDKSVWRKEKRTATRFFSFTQTLLAEMKSEQVCVKSGAYNDGFISVTLYKIHNLYKALYLIEIHLYIMWVQVVKVSTSRIY